MVKKYNKIYLFIILLSFYFFTIGKFIIIFFTFINLIKDFFSESISLLLKKAYGYAFIILLIFMFSFLSAVINGNNILHIIRNNFYTLIFIFTGIQVVYIYRNNFKKLMEDMIKIISILALIQIIIYIFSILNLSFHIFVDNILSKKIGYSISFAGLGEFNKGFGLKMVTNLSPLYLFLIPYAFYTNNTRLKKYTYIIVLTVIISVSITQYFILFIYILIYYIRLMKYPLLFFSKIINIKNLIILLSITYFIFSSGLFFVLEEKINNLFNYNSKTELTSASVRIVQAKILLEEFSDSPLVGKGLGYDSKKYHKIRDIINGNREIKYFNYSMYENQYLDILMKFGILGAILIYFLFFFYPLYILFKKYLIARNNLYLSIIMGLIGVTIFAGSNGNTFYAYTTMFIWGIIINLVSTKNIYKKRVKK